MFYGLTNKKIGFAVAFFIIMAVVFGWGYSIGERNNSLSELPPVQISGNATPEGIDFSPFWRAWSVLGEKFVPATSSQTVSDQDKVWGAIEGLAASYGDPYTVFFPPAESEIFESDINGNFEGVGMEIGIRDNVLTVVAPLKGTPAEKSGIESGDRILEIDNLPTSNMSIEEAVKRIRGKRGTKVVLTVVHEGGAGSLKISIERDVIDIPTIETDFVRKEGSQKSAGLLNNGIFVIRLFNFSANSANLFRAALREFVLSQSDKLIIDLRGNPGGYLEAAIDMASWFLPSGKAVVIEEYVPDMPQEIHRSKGFDIFNENLKLVILVNKGSASASEILAGALEEQGIATLVGEKTYGKGSVQELVKITPETSLKVTVAQWLTPNGKSISENGLTPNVEVKLTPEDIEAGKDPQMDKAVEILLGK